MSAKAVIHINGKDYDASSGEALTQKKHEDAGPKHSSPTRAAAHHVKPPLVHHVPHKSTTLARSVVRKPKIISDIRNTPVELMPQKVEVKHEATHSHQSPKVMHFAKIEPRMIDTTPVAPPQAYPDSPPPIVHHLKKHSKTETHIKRQLAAATAHKAIPHKPVHRHAPLHKRASALAAGAAVLVMIAGFVVYQSVPGLSVDLASRQAGFTAMLPKYTPGGFKMSGPVEYGQGRVVLSFNSNTDDRAYKIEQEPSLLTDSELKEQVAKDSAGKFQAVDNNGQAVFIANGSAMWVNDGVLFSLKGDSGLSSTQIASIASSL